MKILDANMILRFLLRDNIEMSNTVKTIIENNVVMITNEVIAEVVYVLSKVYHLERTVIASSLLQFLNIRHIAPTEANVLKNGIQLYGEYNLDFVDCLMCAYHMTYGYEVCTFDKKLLKLIQKI